MKTLPEDICLINRDPRRAARAFLRDVPTRQAVLDLQEELARRLPRLEREYSAALDAAALETWGRPYRFTDYKVSGIASDEFGEAAKNQLRSIVHDMQRCKDAQRCAAHVLRYYGRALRRAEA